jgi:hypothetical protein
MKMYVLYYEESDYDYHQFEIIAVSKDKEKLQAEKESLSEINRKFVEKIEEYNDKNRKHYEMCQKKVREFLLDNLDCIKENRQPMYNGYVYIKDWHTSDGRSYSPHQKFEIQKKNIDTVVNRHSSYFQKGVKGFTTSVLEQYIDFSKLKSPIDFIEAREFEQPLTENRGLPESCLFIEEVKVI